MWWRCSTVRSWSRLAPWSTSAKSSARQWVDSDRWWLWRRSSGAVDLARQSVQSTAKRIRRLIRWWCDQVFRIHRQLHNRRSWPPLWGVEWHFESVLNNETVSSMTWAKYWIGFRRFRFKINIKCCLSNIKGHLALLHLESTLALLVKYTIYSALAKQELEKGWRGKKVGKQCTSTIWLQMKNIPYAAAVAKIASFISLIVSYF